MNGRQDRTRSLFFRLAAFQTRRPWLVILLTFLTLGPAGWLTVLLFSDLRQSFTELLPDNKPSVVEMRRISGRLAGVSTLTLVAEGTSRAALKRFVDDMVPRIEGLGPEWVAAADSGHRAAENFFESRRHVYAPLEDIQKLHDEVLDRWDYEVGKETGTTLDVVDEADVPPPLTAERIRERLGVAKPKPAEGEAPAEANAPAPPPEADTKGYWIGEDEKGLYASILVRTPFSAGSPQAHELERRINELVQDAQPELYDPGIKIYYTGNLITSADERRRIERDLTEVGGLGVGLVLGVVFLFFLRFRALFAMGATILVGCLWSFAVAYLAVGYLNTATMFLVSIIAGNGINFGIIYMAKYLEVRRGQALALRRGDAVPPTLAARLEAAVVESHFGTARATLAASVAAGVAYASLAATDFRGFRHFGVIAGAGMLLCWLATYWLLPSLLVVADRVRPLFEKEALWRLKARGVYGYPFAWLASRFSKTISVVGVALGLACAVLTVRYLANDPIEYDLHNVRTDPGESRGGELSTRVDRVVGRVGQDGWAILTESVEQVAPLVKELERRRDTAPKSERPFGKVASIYDLLPKEQEEKLELVEETLDVLRRARDRGFIDEAAWTELEPELPKDLAPVEMSDLPELARRSFTESDGTVGRIVYIAPIEGRSVYDGRYLMLWADAFREVRLPNGDVIRGTGNPVIFSDMLVNIQEDAPLAIGLSLGGTILVMLFAFRWRPIAALAFGSLALGILYLLGVLAVANIHLNFLSFIAVPIGIGVGADYVLNILKSQERVTELELFHGLVTTGGAVVLCSLTTTLGYAALMLSINGAVRSFGLAAAVGEITTLLAAVLVLPAILFWMARARKQRTGT